MQDLENHGLDYAHSFSNEDGFEEWMTCDELGNAVHCYDNGYMEIHTKIPICKFCGKLLTKISAKTWKCDCCGKRRTYESLIHEIDDLNSYIFEEKHICDDYGEFMDRDATIYMVGPNELYDELTSGT